MTSRFARLCIVGVLLSVVGDALAQAPTPLPQVPAPAQSPSPLPNPALLPPRRTAPVNPAPANEEMVTLKLPDADIDTILSALHIYTGKFILHPAVLPTVPGGYNLMIDKPIPKSQAILYLETILAMNNIAVLPMGDEALKVVQLPSARVESPQLIEGSTLNLPPSSKVASKLFKLDFLRVQEFQPMLQNITNPNFGAAVPLVNANAILVTDTISNLQRIETLLDQVDRPVVTTMATKFYALHNGAKASDVVARLHSILTGALQQQLGSETTYTADDRSNQVIVITDPRQFPFFDDLITKLDVRADPNTANEVIYLKHAKASDVAQVLVRIIQGQNQATQRESGGVMQTPLQPTTPTPPSPLGKPAAPPQPTIVSGSGAGNAAAGQGTTEFSPMVTVVNDDRSNSIVVSGTYDDIRLIKQLVDKLDIVLAQVRIEVVIAEVTLDDNHQSGISQLGLQLDGDKLVGFSADGGTSGTPITIGGNGAGTFATITRPGGTTTVSGPWDLAGIISLGTSPRKSNTTILTVPAIVTSHGKQGVISDGETRPVITGTTSYTGATSVPGATTSQVTQQQIGTTLTVTPYIGNDGTVQMDIQQELSNVTGTIPVDGNTQYIIGTRKTTSYVTAKSGDIIVLGGFRQDRDIHTTSRLGGIPIIGDLLGARQREKAHQELIFFLRPTVLSNNPDIDNAETMRRMDKLPTHEEIKQDLYPDYQPPKKPLLDRILPH